MRTELCERLGIEVPIFAFTHCRDVVVEVSRAGGLGVLGAAGFRPEQLEKELQWIDDHVDGKPYGVDVIMPTEYVDADPKALADMIPDGQLIEIGFDELDDAPMETMERIYKELNLGGLEDARPAMKTYLDSVKQYRRNKYRPLSVSKLNKIHAAWEFWFKEFGYKQQGIEG